MKCTLIGGTIGDVVKHKTHVHTVSVHSCTRTSTEGVGGGRDRETDRETDSETDRETDRKTDRKLELELENFILGEL